MKKASLIIIILLFDSFPFFAQPAKWTVLVYMNADNNLEEQGISDFFEMSESYYSKEVNVLVQMDRTHGYTDDFGDWTGTLRFQMRNGILPLPSEAKVDLNETNMGDPKTLRDFIDWGKSNYPASHYILVIWGHGNGWKYLDMSTVDKNTQTAYLEDYKENLKASNALKEKNAELEKFNVSNMLAQLTVQKHKLVSNLNETSQMITLPIELKLKIDEKSNFKYIQDTYLKYIKQSYDKIPVEQYKFLDAYSTTINSLLDLEYTSKRFASLLQPDTKAKSNTGNLNFTILSASVVADNPVKAVSSDDTDKDMLYNKEIQNNILDNEFEVIGFDACLMSMIETGYALKSKTRFIVGSEELVPGTGWDYRLWLGDISNNPEMTSNDITRNIVENYGKTYSSDRDEVTMSGLNTSLIQELSEKVDLLSKILIQNIAAEASNIKNSRTNCIKYAMKEIKVQNIDLSLFLFHLSEKTSNQNIKTLCAQIRNIIKLTVVSNYFSLDRNFSPSVPSYGSFGIAIYFPNRKIFLDKNYSDDNINFPVDFVTQTSWDNMLLAYYNQTNQ